MDRRSFIRNTGLAVTGLAMNARAGGVSDEPVIDIHQHVGYSGRSNGQLIAHQKAMGVTMTILHPAGTTVARRSTLNGHANGLGAGVAGNRATQDFVNKHPESFRFFANDVPDLPGSGRTIRKYLEAGAMGIGEQKFAVEVDSKYIESLALLAREFQAPILLHFENGKYNHGLERFHKVLEKFPDVNFIGHAQTWWGNIDSKHDQEEMLPSGEVTAGGITDRLLGDYPNVFGDLSSRYGLNALLRDEDHATEFLIRHQEKLLFGSDCNDDEGQGSHCFGSQILSTVRRLAAENAVRRKILYRNAMKLLKFSGDQ